MKENREKNIVVLGMHRTGTSLTSGVLTRLGVNMGEDLLGDTPTNILGLFEDRDFLNLNRQILNDAGGSWDNPPEIKSILSQKERYQEKIEQLIHNRNNIWGWKDPRTSLTINLYLPFLSNPYFIVCHRNENSVAASLLKWNNIENQKAIEIINIYRNRIENFFLKNKNLKKIDISYEEFTSKPKEILKKIVKFLDLSVDNKKYQSSLNFILPNKKIHQLGRRNLMIRRIKYYSKKPWEIPMKLKEKIIKSK